MKIEKYLIFVMKKKNKRMKSKVGRR